jgi:hypothetical protein
MIPPDRSIPGEILVADESTPALHLGNDQVGNPAVIKTGGTAVADGLQCGGQFRLPKGGAFYGRSISREKGCARSREESEPGAVVGNRETAVLIHHEAITGQPDSRLDDHCKGEFTMAAMCLGQSGHRTGYTRREMPGDARVLACGAIHVASSQRGCRFPVVECLHSSIPGTNDHESAATDIPSLGMNHGQREANRHRRVDRIASSLEDIPAHLAGDGTSRYDDGLRRSGDPCPP